MFFGKLDENWLLTNDLSLIHISLIHFNSILYIIKSQQQLSQCALYCKTLKLYRKRSLYEQALW